MTATSGASSHAPEGSYAAPVVGDVAHRDAVVALGQHLGATLSQGNETELSLS